MEGQKDDGIEVDVDKEDQEGETEGRLQGEVELLRGQLAGLATKVNFGQNIQI